VENNNSNIKKNSIIGIIPQYPKNTQHNIFSEVKMPPIGIISVLSQLKERYAVYAIDENNYAGPREDLTKMPEHKFLHTKKPAQIAMLYGGMSNSIPRMYSIAKQYKKFGAITIAGGSHVDALPEEALNSGVDIIIHGEGEETVKELLEKIFADGKIRQDYKRNLENILGISYSDENGSYKFTGKREPIKDLDSLQDPDLTIIKFLRKKWTAIPLSRGRGCNYKCEFCIVSDQYGRYKKTSDEKVLDQIIKYSDLGYKQFFFTDDNFAQNQQETIELCNKISDYKKRFKKKINIIVQVRTEVAKNDELIAAMKQAGVSTLCIGYESPIDEELKAMRKGVLVDELVQRSRKLSDKFYIHGMFIFGYPTFKDSKHKSQLTLDQKAKEYEKFFKKSKIDTIQVLNAIPLPGTELRTKLEKEERLLPLDTVGWEKHDGLFLCYDPTQEGINAYDLQNLPKILMKRRYQGNILNKVNYGNWINWAYNATIGFPIQFSTFYTKRLVHNLIERSREKKIIFEEQQKTNVFEQTLQNTWSDIKRKWRNLAVKTYASGIVDKWYKEYRKSDYAAKLEKLFTKRA